MAAQYRYALRILLILVSACAVSGCSTATLTAGAQLAKAGQTASAQMEQNASISGSTMITFENAIAFNDGFNNAIGNAASRTVLNNEWSIQANLANYAKLLESLAAAYSALGDLSTYSATAVFNSSMAQLTQDYNTLAKSLNPGAQVPALTASIVSSAGGLIVASIQAREVRQASAAIETQLNAIIVLLSEPDTRNLIVVNSKEVTGNIAQAAIAAYDSGAYSYDALLDTVGAPLGLKSYTDSDKIVRASPGGDKLRAGLRNVANEISNEQVQLIADSYDKSLSALRALIPLHESLNNGAALNLDTLASLTSQLQTIALQLQSKGK